MISSLNNLNNNNKNVLLITRGVLSLEKNLYGGAEIYVLRIAEQLNARGFQVGIIADSTRYILTEVMGFEEEIPDEDGKYDIYIVDFNSDYGWNHYDENENNGSSFLKIDNDYS